MQDLTENDWANIILDKKNYSKEARIQAAFHLENFTSEKNLDKMLLALETDPSPIVRHEIAFSLGETASCTKKVEDALKKAIENDKNLFVKHEAMLALSTLGNKESISFLEKYLKDKNKEISESAEIAIQRIKGTFENENN